MRDKYEFTADLHAPPSHQGYQQALVGLFALNKQARKTNANDAIARLDASLLNVVTMTEPQIHQALHAYEKDYLTRAGNWPRLKQALALRFRNIISFQDTLNDSTISFTVQGIRAPVGIVRFGLNRFVPIAAQPFGNNPTIYERREQPGRHYILLPKTNTYVKRFVTRGLSAYDGMRLSTGFGIIAAQRNLHGQQSEVGGSRHPATDLNEPLSIDEQILSHTRGWGGNKRFISTGVSNRPVYSTLGKQFQSMYGAVVVDLARVPLNTVYDVHAPATAQIHIGLSPDDVVRNLDHTGTRDLAEQKYLALRDVLRTRELLIHGTIPAVALQRNPVGQVLLGIGAATNNQHKGFRAQYNSLPLACRNAVVGQADRHTFTDTATNKQWSFIEFNNQGLCAQAFNAWVLKPGQVKVRFDKFAMVRPLGMV